jgi:hypothetical protein
MSFKVRHAMLWAGLAAAALLLAWPLLRPYPDAADVRPGGSPTAEAASPGQGTGHARAKIRMAAALGHDDLLMQLLRERLWNGDALPNQAILTFKSPEAMRRFLHHAEGSNLRVLGRIGAFPAVRVGYGSLEQLRDAIQGDPSALADIGGNYAVQVPTILQPENRAAGIGVTPFDGTGFLSAIGADANRADWGKGVTVAVVDTGVENHPTLTAAQITHYDLVNDGQPFDGHGTAMAGLIAGQDPAAPGVAPASRILDVRVANAQGLSDTFTLAAGIVQAADAGAQIINVSLGSQGDSQTVRDAVVYAESRGAVVVAAAGNEQVSQLSFPAAIPSVISVGGVDAQLQQAYFSNSGTGLDVTAPAVGITSAYGKDQLVIGDGTSQATAITTGVLASGLSRGATTTAGATDWLKQNAKPLNLTPEQGGAGMVQAPAH